LRGIETLEHLAQLVGLRRSGISRHKLTAEVAKKIREEREELAQEDGSIHSNEIP
jgi:hypothetical protein